MSGAPRRRHTLKSDPVHISAEDRAYYQALLERDSAWKDPEARDACKGILSYIPFGGGNITRQMSIALQKFDTQAARLPRPFREVFGTEPTVPAEERTTMMPAPTAAAAPLAYDPLIGLGELCESLVLSRTKVHELLETKLLPLPTTGGDKSSPSWRWKNSVIEQWKADHATEWEKVKQTRAVAGIAAVSLEARIGDLEARVTALEREMAGRL